MTILFWFTIIHEFECAKNECNPFGKIVIIFTCNQSYKTGNYFFVITEKNCIFILFPSIPIKHDIFVITEKNSVDFKFSVFTENFLQRVGAL